MRQGCGNAMWVAWVVVCAIGLSACGGGSVAGLMLGDLDGDGIPDDRDNDLDGDGLLNQFDPDVDNDGLHNDIDPDGDDDGIANGQDTTPLGPWIPAAQTLFVTSGVATVNFGDVPQGQVAGPAEITIQNDSVNSVTISRVALTGNGSGTYAIDSSTVSGTFTLAPGAARVFTATYTPRGGEPALGRVDVDIRIGSQTFHAVVNLLGQGSAPALTASGAPTTINFGNVPVGIVAGPGVATLRNDTTNPVIVTDVNVLADGGGTFALDLAPLGGALPLTVPAGAQARFHVTYAPKSGVPNIGEVRVEIDLGTSTRSLALDLLGQGLAPSMTVAEEVDFGSALNNVEVVDIELEIRNEFFATGTLQVASVTLPEDALGDFEIVDDPSPFQIAPGGTPVRIGLRFRPQGDRFGLREGTLRIDGNLLGTAVSRDVDLLGRSGGWQAPDTASPANLTGASLPRPLAISGSSLFVVRSAGPDGVWGTTLNPDDEIVVLDSDPDNLEDTADARIVVRWGGLQLSPATSCAPVDAGNGRHVFFAGPGLDGALGGADDQIHVLDTVSGALRSLACPDVGARKSIPTIVNGGAGLVVVASGTGGGILPSADTLLVYENLLGNLTANAADQTIALGVIVPDVAAGAPVVVNATTVVMPTSDASDNPDLSDRLLNDGNEGLVQVRGLQVAGAVEVIDLARALAEVATPDDGDAFSRPVRVSDTSILVMTAGDDALVTTDDEVVRVDAMGTDTPAEASALTVSHASGIASRPVWVEAQTFVFAGPGADGTYGSADDQLTALDASGAMATTSFGPGEALAGNGGGASILVPFGSHVLATTLGADAAVGGGDDRLVHLDLTVLGAGSILGAMPVPGGLFEGSRSVAQSNAGPTVLDARFVGVLDRGTDGIAGTADDQFRVVRDFDRDGIVGSATDDLTGDDAFDAADAVLLASPFALADASRFAASADAHLFTLQPGAAVTFGGGDDAPVVWQLRETNRLP